jgi:hypothetical protein
MQSELSISEIVGWRYVALAFLLLINSCSSREVDGGKVIFTQVPVDAVSKEQLFEIESKYVGRMKIVMADMVDENKGKKVLSKQFFSARSPEVSFDGKELVFSAQKSQGDTWQIWRLNLVSEEIVQVSDSRTNCTDPIWLPNGDIAFSKLITEEMSLKHHALFTIGKDGCCEQRITFQPHEDVNSSVLHDGRILVGSRQVYPEAGPLKYLALRPDGTKAELFHLADDHSRYIGKAMEGADGLVLFCEDQVLTSVRFSRPLHSKSPRKELVEEMAHSLFAMADGSLLVSLKKQGASTYGISLIDESGSLTEKFHEHSSDFHQVEPQLVQARKGAKKLPTTVNPELNYGYIMAMNADASDIKAEGKTATVQVMGMSDLIGQVDVEKDGSFYLELPSDKPLRFQTLDENGKVLRGPSSWMWLRPNERRACAGCHQDREMTPENIVPMALKKGPLAM